MSLCLGPLFRIPPRGPLPYAFSVPISNLIFACLLCPHLSPPPSQPPHTPPSPASVQLRIAVGHLGALTGKVTVDKVLDVIFADFCIGK